MIYETIAGISTAVGNSGISVIRLSGPDAVLIGDIIFTGKTTVKEQESHTVQYGKIRDPETGDIVDEVLLTKMMAPRTYTREDVVEISTHGGYTIARTLLNLLYKNGARPAEPGEFTKRAFINGRIDLSQAEAVMDIIQARTQRVSKVAVRQLEGDVSNKLNQIRESLILLLSNIEVNLDYPEHDIEEVTLSQAEKETKKVIIELDTLIDSFRFGKLLKEGMEVVIAGKPNVGKSSLMNRLTRKNRSIVTDIPGTTRDTIEEYINIKGIPVKLVDTAGVRTTKDIVEQQGVERSLKAISNADFIIVLFDSSQEISPEDQVIINRAKKEKKPYILCFNKIDLIKNKGKLNKLIEKNPEAKFISIAEDAGIEEIEDCLIGFATKNNQDIDNQVLITNTRHEHQLKEARKYLDLILLGCKNGNTLDMVALDLKAALEELGKITGHHADEDVINVIFSRFCLGK